MAVTDLSNSLEIAAHRRNRTRRGTDHGFGDERHHRFRAEAEDFLLKRIGGSSAVVLLALAGLGEAILEARIDQSNVDQQWGVGCPPPRAPAGSERPKRVPVIALAPCDDLRAAGIAALEMILARKLEGGLDRLRAASREPDPVERARRHFGDEVGKFFSSTAGEESRVNILEARSLFRDRCGDFGMAMPDARNRRSAACVDIAASVFIDQVNALPTYGDRRARCSRTVEDVPQGHYARLTSAALAAMLCSYKASITTSRTTVWVFTISSARSIAASTSEARVIRIPLAPLASAMAT